MKIQLNKRKIILILLFTFININCLKTNSKKMNLFEVICCCSKKATTRNKTEDEIKLSEIIEDQKEANNQKETTNEKNSLPILILHSPSCKKENDIILELKNADQTEPHNTAINQKQN